MSISTPGNMLTGYLHDKSRLAAGQAGVPRMPDTPEGVVPATDEQLRQMETDKLMQPAYDMIAKAKAAEADRIREKMFGIKAGEVSHNPLAKGVPELMAWQVYKQSEPYLEAMRAELAANMNVTADKVPPRDWQKPGMTQKPAYFLLQARNQALAKQHLHKLQVWLNGLKQGPSAVEQDADKQRQALNMGG